jgi:hypothetical protein
VCVEAKGAGEERRFVYKIFGETPFALQTCNDQDGPVRTARMIFTILFKRHRLWLLLLQVSTMVSKL